MQYSSFWSSDILTGNQTAALHLALQVWFWSSDILTGNQTSTFDVIAESRSTLALCVIVRAHTMTGAGHLMRQMGLTGLEFDAADYALRDGMPIEYRTMSRRVDMAVYTEEDGPRITMVEDVTGRKRDVIQSAHG